MNEPERAESPVEGNPDAGAPDAEAAPTHVAPSAADDAEASADSEGSESEDDASEDDASGEGPRKRKRKRRRKRHKSGETPVAVVADVAQTMASLRSGLFSHIDDREVPCRVDGCDRVWVWTASEQIAAFGQPPPRRMCAVHEASIDELGDRQVTCSNPGCDKTWTFTRAAALAQMQRTGSSEPPARTCDDCIRDEKELADREVACRVDTCNRTWTWSRDAQLKHRAWVRRNGDAPVPARGGKRGRRSRRRPSIHEAPARLCEPCHEKLAKLTPEAGPCKVHGCTRTAPVDKEQQLRAWAALHTDDLDAVATLPRRMCEVCREFCRAHPDREVPCGRPGCDKSWTFKTGAQLQAMLAGRHDDPIRLCDECVRGGFAREVKGPGDSEIMPCVVPLCEGVWYYVAGTHIAPARLGDFADLPIDRMCDDHRRERGAEPATPVPNDESTPHVDAAEPSEPAATTGDAGSPS